MEGPDFNSSYIFQDFLLHTIYQINEIQYKRAIFEYLIIQELNMAIEFYVFSRIIDINDQNVN